MTPKKARLKDIALLAGVSIGTVDRVLHKRGEVADKTKVKILKISRDLDYSPNYLARALKTKKRINIVSLLPEPTEENAFWKKHPDGISKAINELDPFPVNHIHVFFDLLSEKDFQKKTIEVLSCKPDGVILAPIFKTEAITFCNLLSENNVPFVFVDGYISETNFLAYTGEDIYQSGRVAGQLTAIVTPPGKDILIINIARNLQNVHHLNNRTEGFLNYFRTNGKNTGEKIICNIPNSDQDSIKAGIEKAFEKNPEIASIFISGSKAYKVADYIESKGKITVNIIGYDLLEKNVSYLNTGTIKFLIGQRPEEQTYKGVKKLFEFLALDRIPEKIEYLPVDIVTSENVIFFL